MSNPINVSISVTQPNVTLYIMVDTFAAYTQKADIQCPNQKTFTASGNGEGKRIGYWTYPISAAGIYTFQCRIQYDDGSGFKLSKEVATGSFSTLSLNQTIVFSEDAGDSDMNDCFITFMWFAKNVAQK